MNDELNPDQKILPEDGGSSDWLNQALNDLSSLRPEGRNTPGDASGRVTLVGPDSCPDPGAWLRLVLEGLPEGETEKLLAHASMCAGCLERLRLSRLALSAEATAEEAVDPQKLVSSSANWQRQFAAKLAGTPRKSSSRRMPALVWWAAAGLAATLLLAFGFDAVWQYRNSPERLLAQAYTRSRTFDLRVPGAQFAKVVPETHLRGGATDNEPPQLLTARALIESKLEQRPSDPELLHLEARADLLEEKYDAAIDILDRLLAQGPVTAALLTDDASAYFQRGLATGSENDRATALENLRRADTLAPDDPVVLFNEAVVMEDRGLVSNAVDVWNRYLKVEHDPAWLAEGRQRLQMLQTRLTRLKSHQTRIEQHLATPQAMRALAADPYTLDTLDEELSTSLLPRLLNAAFPLPVDRSRGSPCNQECLSARSLLHALSVSLRSGHQDPWLSRLLPPASTPPSPQYIQAVRALAAAISANLRGDYLAARPASLQSEKLFRAIGNNAGDDRAQLELAYAQQRLALMNDCFHTAHALIRRDPQFLWIHAEGLIEDGICNDGPGTATDIVPAFQQAARLTAEHHFALLGMRARNMIGGIAIESGDTEDAWRAYIGTLRLFYAGDYPPFRAYTILSGVAEVEKSTPRVQLELLLQKETMRVLQLTDSRSLFPYQRYDLAIAEIRAGDITAAQADLSKVRTELSTIANEKSVSSYLADSEVAMASYYLSHKDLASASSVLDRAKAHLANTDDDVPQRMYAAARGQLDLALGRPDVAEPMVRAAILEEEREARNAGSANIIFAQQNRDLYAVLAGLWLAQDRPAQDVLALWERYRLRILGRPAPLCPDNGLACLAPQLSGAMDHLDDITVLGQIVLLDRTLLFQVTAHRVTWSSVPVGRQQIMAMAGRLDQAVSSPATSQTSIHQAAQRIGNLLLPELQDPGPARAELTIESDPALGNMPWAAVETVLGPLGLRFDLQETPSLLLSDGGRQSPTPRSLPGKPLVIGASLSVGGQPLLPEALQEAQAVARFGDHANLLLAQQATRAHVASHLGTATILHFAGHATEYNGALRLLLAPSGTPGDKPYLDSAFFLKHPPRSVRLAVFSTCASGRDQEGWDHGMEDVVDTLSSLGVPSVVATRWQIDSASAVPMMEAFYRGLAKGLSVPRALTAARLSLIRDPRYRHPYYWAAYYDSGFVTSPSQEVLNASIR